MIGEIGVVAKNGHTHLFRFPFTVSGMSALIDHLEELVANPDKTDLTPLDFVSLSLELKGLIWKLLQSQQSPSSSPFV